MAGGKILGGGQGFEKIPPGRKKIGGARGVKKLPPRKAKRCLGGKKGGKWVWGARVEYRGGGVTMYLWSCFIPVGIIL